MIVKSKTSMGQSITVVMYHYVRDVLCSRYPRIKARNIADFRGQIEYFASRYVFVTVEDILLSYHGRKRLPDNAMWLTFDDGYIDHFATVFPYLYNKGIQGSFFPVSNAVMSGEMLDVNKIHFIMDRVPRIEDLQSEIELFVQQHQGADGILTVESYREKYAIDGLTDPRDDAKASFVKSMLQRGLVVDQRKCLLNKLFEEFVGISPGIFAKELYMSCEQLKAMIKCGMYVGGHGSNHLHMATLGEAEQEREIKESLSFLASIGAPTQDWVFCYPYGSNNEITHQLSKKHGASIGLTTVEDVASAWADQPFSIPRLDTNSFPTSE